MTCRAAARSANVLSILSLFRWLIDPAETAAADTAVAMMLALERR